MKTFVIDTNVFIHKPDCLQSFRENEVVIPLMVLEELDQLKRHSDERGRNARHAIRFIDEISKHGNLSEGAKMDNGSVLRVELAHAKNTPSDMLQDKPDNRIIMTAYSLQKRKDRQVFFVSKDINARVKATALGIKAVDYEKQKVNINTLYSGFREMSISEDNLADFREEGSIKWNEDLVPNEYLILKDEKNSDRAIGKYKEGTGLVEYVGIPDGNVAGIKPLNEKQKIAFDLLLDDEIKLVSLVGKAGTGKTLLAIAAGLKMIFEEKTYSRMLVSRPVIPLGKDIGYLPGQKAEKLSHWMQPLFDNLEYILGVYTKPNFKSVEQAVTSKKIELEALSYIRGRSLPSQYIIIDEAQNLTPHEIKTVVSRAGEGTKVVLTGDPYQIDSPYLDSNSNGLTYLVEAFKGNPIFGHVILQKSERSQLAELAAELL
ncbi:MAG: PhoH family protein [Spirochaetia bacterium]